MKRSLFSKGLCFALAIGVLGIAGGVVAGTTANNTPVQVNADQAKITFGDLWSNDTTISSATTINSSPKITVLGTKGSGSNVSKYFNNGTSIRIYKGGDVTFEIEEGYVLSSIAITARSGYGAKSSTISCSTGSFTGLDSENTSTSWSWNIGESAATNKVTFTNTNTSSTQIHLQAVTITYDLTAPTVTLSESTLSGEVNDTFDLTATVENMTSPSYEWTSSNTDAVSVAAKADAASATVTLKAVTNDPVTVTVTAKQDTVSVSASCSVSVFSALPTSVTVTDSNGGSSGSIGVGGSIQLSSAVLPSDADQTVTWSSAEETIAAVDETGLVKGVSAGSTTITATSSVDTVKGTYTVTVVGYNYELVTDASDLVLGDTYTIGYNNGTSSYAISATQSDNNRKGVEISVASNAFVASDGSASIGAFILGAGTVDGTYSFYQTSGTASDKGYLYAASSGSNHLKTQDNLTVNSSFKITFTTETTTSGTTIKTSVVATGSSNRNVLQFNNGNNSKLFSCYSSASQEDVSLFRATNVDNEGEANKWASDFIAASGNVCSAEQDLANPDGLMGGLSITSLKVPAQDILKYATASQATGDLKTALERYDFIVNKYTTCTDVLKRRAEAATSQAINLFGNGQDNGLIAMASILGIGLGTGAVVILARKKKRVR